MSIRRTKVSVRHWREANKAMQAALREGNRLEAIRWAHTLLQYLTEMGLLDDRNRQGYPHSSWISMVNTASKKEG